jgi:hypothetical protein
MAQTTCVWARYVHFISFILCTNIYIGSFIWARPTQHHDSHAGRRQPTKANTCPRQPTKANAGPRQLMQVHDSSRRPTTAHAGPRQPTKTGRGPQQPRKANAGPQQLTQVHDSSCRPTMANTGQMRLAVCLHGPNDMRLGPVCSHFHFFDYLY